MEEGCERPTCTSNPRIVKESEGRVWNRRYPTGYGSQSIFRYIAFGPLKMEQRWSPFSTLRQLSSRYLDTTIFRAISPDMNHFLHPVSTKLKIIRSIHATRRIVYFLSRAYNSIRFSYSLASTFQVT